MFLNNTTIQNIQTRLNTQVLRSDAVIMGIYQARGITAVRMTIDATDVVAIIESIDGFLADHIADAIRWQSYYHMSDIYAGLECDDEAERILHIWPETDGRNVSQLRPQGVADQPLDIKAASLKLQEKFGGRRK